LGGRMRFSCAHREGVSGGARGEGLEDLGGCVGELRGAEADDAVAEVGRGDGDVSDALRFGGGGDGAEHGGLDE